MCCFVGICRFQRLAGNNGGCGLEIEDDEQGIRGCTTMEKRDGAVWVSGGAAFNRRRRSSGGRCSASPELKLLVGENEGEEASLKFFLRGNWKLGLGFWYNNGNK
ncbi:hypothetical protein HAX54_050954 [Datura stramonium]|uniref:Uncharacterized protein n=1 Tax=Datura stramonium TaxID=4076 RepID=A0ABS8WRQ0_DATST|nr:hypothetical protein [Datura stramonium]